MDSCDGTLAAAGDAWRDVIEADKLESACCSFPYCAGPETEDGAAGWWIM